MPSGHDGDGPRTGGGSGELRDEEKGDGRGGKWSGGVSASQRGPGGGRAYPPRHRRRVIGDKGGVGRATDAMVGMNRDEGEDLFAGCWAEAVRG